MGVLDKWKEEVGLLVEEEQVPTSNISIPGEPSKVISVRQNNPGNIKVPSSGLRPRQIGKGTRDFGIYETPEDGFLDIQDLIDDVYSKDTIRSMAERYAPRTENDTDTWIANVSKLAGVPPDTPVTNIPKVDLAKAIAKVESGTVVKGTPQAAVEKIASGPVGVLDKWKRELEEATSPAVEEAPPSQPSSFVGPEAAFEGPDEEGGKQLWSGVGWALDAPHRYITEPYVMEPTRKVLEFLLPGITKPIDVPAGAVMPEAEWMGKESKGEITVPGAGEVLTQGIGVGADSLVYGLPLKLVSKGISLARRGKPSIQAPIAEEPVDELRVILGKDTEKAEKLKQWIAPVKEDMETATATLAREGKRAEETIIAGGYKIPRYEQSLKEVQRAREDLNFWQPKMQAKQAELAQVQKQIEATKGALFPEDVVKEAARLDSIPSEVHRVAVAGGRVRPDDELVVQGLSEASGIKNAKDFAVQAGIPSKIKRGQSTFPDEFSGSPIDPEVPPLVKDASGSWVLKSYNVTARGLLGQKNNWTNDYMAALNTRQANAYDARQVLDNLFQGAGLKKDVKLSLKAAKDELAPVFEEYVKRLQGLKAEGVEITPAKVQEVAGDLLRERDRIVRSLGARYANVRIKAAAEGESWAVALLNPKEQNIVGEIRKYLDSTKARMQEQGMKVFEGKPYVPYLFQRSGFGELDAPSQAFISSSWLYGDKRRIPELLEFIERTPGSKDWFPLGYQSLWSYMGGTEYKLAFNPFLKKWRPLVDSWKTTSGSEAVNARDALFSFLKRNMTAENASSVDKAINTAVNLEYFKDVAMSYGIATLHLFKLAQTPMWHGIFPTMKGTWSFGKALTQMARGQAGPEAKILSHFLRSQQLTRAILQESGAKMLQPGPWSKITRGVGEIAISPTKAVEYLDNGINLFAAMHKGIGAGADASTIRNLIYDSMQLLNFRGFSAPGFMTRGGGTRAATMFMMTPYKLVENKGQLLIRGLTGKKDVLGNSEFWKAIRFLTFTGATYKLAKDGGFDLSRHLIHLPGVEVNIPELVNDAVNQDWEAVKRRLHHVELRLPPIFQYAGGLMDKGIGKVSEEWVGWPGPIAKTWQEPIPDKYDDSRLRYIFGLPKPGWQEAKWGAAERAERRREKSERKRSPSATRQLLDDHGIRPEELIPFFGED